ncbi:MAG: hypothetical protein DMF25_08200 [Verrucomicrobia bacterium]|nr:MAG: hypothetical protein DMF25_08200 [Verrucomicrobiota bacterium]
MLRDVALLAVIAATTAFAQDNGTKQETDSFDVEPPLLVPNRADAELPDTASSEAGTPDVDLAKLEKDFERAKRNAAGAEHLYRIGVISQVELEQRALRVLRLEADLANSRLERAKEQAAAVSSVMVNGQAVNDERTKADLAQLTQAAQAAAAKRERAELDVAEANLHRQQELLAVGSARKSDVARAEQQLAELKGQKN